MSKKKDHLFGPEPSIRIPSSEIEKWSLSAGVPYRTLVGILEGELRAGDVYISVLESVIPDHLLDTIKRSGLTRPSVQESFGTSSLVPAGDIELGELVDIINVGKAPITAISETGRMITLNSGDIVVFYGRKTEELAVSTARRTT